jgi:16S rRNA (adenine1518-N6/adenine1519-N6)-dimethyltransferase
MARPLGQHFLTDPAILDRIVAALDPTPADVVLEVGPGEGTLTRRLAPRVGRVIAIEKDRRLAELLRGAAPPLPPNVEVIEGDALEVDWGGLAGAAGAGSSTNDLQPTANGQRPTANGQRPTANG